MAQWGDLLGDLEAMPRFLETIASAFPGDKSRRRPVQEDFSFVENVWHLADLEREGFGVRIHRLLSETRPELPDFDGARIARERDYRARDLRAGLAEFSRARKDNLASLEGLTSEERARSGVQAGVGPITLAEIPAKMAEHDRSHRKDIEALRRLVERD
jgi:hypothetical protein